MKALYEPVFVDNFPKPTEMEQGKLYISKKYKLANHLCLCGCGEETVTPFDRGDKYWQLVEELNGTVSLIGSIGNFNIPCKSHYIMTENIATWCD